MTSKYLEDEAKKLGIGRAELSFDGMGINGPDKYRSRLATFTHQEGAEQYGKLFAAAPDMLAVLREFVEDTNGLREHLEEEWPDLLVTLDHARAAIAKAEGTKP